ncbi:MAG TPA: fibronectin type III domain-containing protein [Thermoanaerobaculia bacterium]|jgi:hypothetical protein|nr:fibronectin type III domain-containing protein [Thermoanaerobaculia bacterium]
MPVEDSRRFSQRRFSPSILAILVTCFASLFAAGAHPADAAVPVPAQLILTVRETAGVARVGEVVRSGVPVPRGLNLLGTAGLAVVDAAGTPVPAELEVTARWNAGRNAAAAPIQWLLVTFPATVGANQAATYRLVTDGSVANPAPARPVAVTRSGNAVTVDTGAAIFRLGAGSGALFDEVVLDNGKRLIGGGNLTLRTGNADYGHSTTRKVTVEHQGPLTAIVVVQGAYDAPAIGGGQMGSLRRYVFTAGSPTAVIRHAASWEGNLGCNACVTTSTGAPNGVLVQKVRDELAVELGGTPSVTAVGNFGAAAVTGPVGSTQSAWVRQQLRPNRTAPLAFDVNVAGAAATGAKADGGLLAASGPNGTVAIALSHMHRYEPQALRLLPGGKLAVDLVDDKAWLAYRQGLFATLAVTAMATSATAPSRAELNRTTWAPLNRPLHAWPSPEWLASSDAVDEFPVGALPSDLASYDTMVRGVLNLTVQKIDSVGINGLMTFGVYPRYWGQVGDFNETDCGANGGGDPTPAESWDNTFWCTTWTDYHNTVSTAQVWAMRTGEVEWLDEIAFPGALRTLHTQIMQCSPTDSWFYCGQAPAGYGAYRTDFNSSHAYFENLFLYYWLTGDQTVVETLQRGAGNMRRWECPLRPGSACPADYPVNINASLTGRVGQQWQDAFRFVGLASSDASFLDDFRSGFARSITQQYARVSKNGVQYGFWGGPALVTTGGTYQTDSQWTIGMYDMHYLNRFAKDTGDEAIGIPALRPSQVNTSIARTFKDIEPVVIGDGTVSGFWARLLEYNWSGDRLAGTLNSVAGADRELYNPEKTGAAEVLIRAGQQTGDASLLDYGRKLTVFMIGEAQREGAPLGKLMGQDLTRLHSAVGLLVQNPGTTTTPPPPPPVPAAPSALAAQAVSSTEIALTWVDNSSNEDAFRVERLSGTTWQEIFTVGAGVTSARVTGLAASTSYSFRVRASNAGGFSPYSNTASATTQATAPPPPPPAPVAPSALAAQAVSTTDITLSWADNSSNEDAFRVERLSGTTWQEILTLSANVTSVRVTGLAASTAYSFRVRASNAGGFSPYSNTASATTQATVVTSTVPAAPSSLAARAASSSEIALTWVDNSTNETAFRVEKLSGTTWQEIFTVGAGVTSARVTGLAASTTYNFRVRASNASGFSTYSNTAATTTLAGTTTTTTTPPPPAAPTGLTAKWLGNGTVAVTWIDNSTTETKFTVERMVSGVYQAQVTVGANVTSANVTGLSSGASYTFRVKVTDAYGQSTYSGGVNVNTF